MKLTNQKIVNDANFLAHITQKQLPIKVSYAIAKNVSKIENELNIYNAEREKLIEKYSVKNEEGKTAIDENNQLKIQENHIEDWNRDIKELLEIEVEIEIHKFSENDLLNATIEMTAAELMLIDYMIED